MKRWIMDWGVAVGALCLSLSCACLSAWCFHQGWLWATLSIGQASGVLIMSALGAIERTAERQARRKWLREEAWAVFGPPPPPQRKEWRS